MKGSLLLVACLTAVTASALAEVDMPMEHHSGSQNTTELTPVAHEMKHEHGLPILQTELTPAERLYWEQYNTTTYFTVESPKKLALWFHCFSILACFIFLYPVSMMLNSVKSRWYIPVLTIHNIMLIISLITLKVFGSSVPDLYPNNAYGKMSWILFFATITQYFVAVLYSATRWVSNGWLEQNYGLEQPFIPLEEIDLERTESHSPSHSTLINSNRSSAETNHLTNLDGDASPTTYRDSDLDDLENDAGDALSNGTFYKANSFAKGSKFIKKDNFLSKLFENKTVHKTGERFQTLITILFHCMNIPMLAYLLIYVSTGAAVGSLLGQAHHVFNILAHLIKGGVFIIYGVFSLARYCGCLSKPGLAWNKAVVLKNQMNTRSLWFKLSPHGMITMEGYESFLVFFYGITNVFLEHLSAEPGVWEAKDLQHASIAFMYIGSGLCGLVTEHILSEWRFNHFLSNTKVNPDAIHAGTPGYSPNPFPLFTIFWTGILMSQHKQSSDTSTMIHMQWGYLFATGSLFRMMTFILLMLVPNKNLNPARPFTELLTSFCLICGGFIFMQSNDQAVQALEYRGLTGMFTLNVNVGLVALIMAWEMVLLSWKNKLQSSEQV
jgi:hypothetical protein